MGFFFVSEIQKLFKDFVRFGGVGFSKSLKVGTMKNPTPSNNKISNDLIIPRYLEIAHFSIDPGPCPTPLVVDPVWRASRNGKGEEHWGPT